MKIKKTNKHKNMHDEVGKGIQETLSSDLKDKGMVKSFLT